MKVNHVGITVRDLESQQSFYTQVLGVEPSVRAIYDSSYTSDQLGYPNTRLDVAIYHIPGTELALELIQYLEPEGHPVETETRNPGTWHLCFEVLDIAAEFARLVRLGAVPRSDEPVYVTSGQNSGGYVAYLRDPEGLTIELFQPPAMSP